VPTPSCEHEEATVALNKARAIYDETERLIQKLLAEKYLS